MSVIVVCEPALKAVVPASAKLPGPSEDWPLPTVSVPSPRRVPSLADAQRAGGAVVVEVEGAAVGDLGDPGRVAGAGGDATGAAREPDRAGARDALDAGPISTLLKRQHADAVGIERPRALGRRRDRAGLRERAAGDARSVPSFSISASSVTSDPDERTSPPSRIRSTLRPGVPPPNR